LVTTSPKHSQTALDVVNKAPAKRWAATAPSRLAYTLDSWFAETLQPAPGNVQSPPFTDQLQAAMANHPRKALVVVRDLLGKEYYTNVMVSGTQEAYATAIDPQHTLHAGTYYVIGSSSNLLQSKKLVIQ